MKKKKRKKQREIYFFYEKNNKKSCNETNPLGFCVARMRVRRTSAMRVLVDAAHRP
jgi:type IV secretory pathway component VirB8